MSPASLERSPEDCRRQVGIGMLGYGFMAKAHTNALRTHPYIFWPDGCQPRLVAICGRTEASVAEAATRYGFEEFGTDWSALVEDERIDIFDNVGPDNIHVEPTLAAIAAGKHVICEKPLARGARDAERMLEAAKRAGVKHMTCFNYRFMPAVRLARELIRSGDIGDIHQAHFRYSQEWRTDPDARLPSSAGALSVIGCHAIDQARFLIGEIVSVSASLTNPVTTPSRLYGEESVEQDDIVAILARLDGGAIATIDASLVSPGRKNMLAWEINGSKGSIAWNLEQLNDLRVHRRGSGGRAEGFTEAIVTEADHDLAAPWWPSAHLLGWEHGHANMLSHFLKAVVDDDEIGPDGADFEDGLKAALVADAVTRSAASGRWESVAKSVLP